MSIWFTETAWPPIMILATVAGAGIAMFFTTQRIKYLAALAPLLNALVSVVGVLVFAGLTAWDTQRLKNDYIYGYASQGGEVAERAAITGALSLYLNFINLFTLLLQLLGQRD